MTDTTVAALAAPTASAPADRRRWAALAVIALVQFMIVLDVTVVNVALPHIQTDLGFSRAGLAWVVDGYTLTAGGLLLLGGRLGDLLGRRRLFLAGVGLFTLASAASGAAVNPGMLVGSRFAQGMGEALATPAAFGLIALLFTDAKERAQAIGITGGMAGLGGTLGPVISGLLIAAGSWRWIFFVNIPVGLFAVVAVCRLVRERRAPRPASAGAPDVAGALTGTGGLVAVVYGLLRAADHPWGSPGVVVPLVAGVAALAAFVARERTAAAPLIPAGVVRHRTRATSNVAALFFACAFFTMFFLVTLYLEQVRHYSALRTGVAYLPVGLVIGLAIGLASVLVPKVGVRVTLVAGGGLFAAGMALLSRITPGGAYATHVLPGLVVAALGAGLSFASFGIAALQDVSDSDASVASGLQSTAQQVGGAVGLAVLATLALRHARGAAAHGVVAAVASTDGYVLALRIGAGVALAGALLSLLADARAGLSEGPAEVRAVGDVGAVGAVGEVGAVRAAPAAR